MCSNVHPAVCKTYQLLHAVRVCTLDADHSQSRACVVGWSGGWGPKMIFEKLLNCNAPGYTTTNVAMEVSEITHSFPTPC